MKKIHFLFVAASVIFTTGSAFSQSTYIANSAVASGEITGIVRNSETGHVVPNIAVIVLQDGELVTGTVADEKGRFRVEQVAPGSYDIKISGAEFQDKINNGVVVAANRVTHLEPQSTEIDFKKLWICSCDTNAESPVNTPKNTWTPTRMVKQSVDFNIFFSSSSN